MTKQIIFLAAIAVMVACCTQKSSKLSVQLNDKDVSSWFEKGDWKHGWTPAADETVNRKEFARQYFLNPGRWNKAFEFLATQDLTAMETGRYELEGADLFVNVSEYATKNMEKVQYEAHRQYADIQYLAKGREQIGVADMKSKTLTVPYDSLKDVAFFAATDSAFRPATAENFFIFFPDDAHRPGVKIQENDSVRKIVVKVRIQ
ncbi:MAG: YhcH/YjgK/YiaL family protein [Prolixibacteraceae bacterium]